MRQAVVDVRRRGDVLAVVVLAIVVDLVAAAAAWSAPVVVDFGDLQELRGPGEGAGVPVTDQYARHGVRFNAPLALDYARAFPTPLPDFPRVGTVAVEPCYAQEFCTRPLVMNFAEPQQRVRLWVGYNGPLDDRADVRLVAFAADGTVVGRTAEHLGPARDRVPVDTPLEVALSSARIVSAEVSVAGFDSALAVDAIEFERGAPELEFDELDVTFGSLSLDRRDVRVVTATNRGTGAAQLEAVTLDGADVFRLERDGCSGRSLPPEASCEMVVTFEPAEPGQFAAVLLVTSDDAAGPHRITLGGEGEEPGAVTQPDERVVDLPLLVAVAGVLAALIAGVTLSARRGRRERWVRAHVQVRARRYLPAELTSDDVGRRQSHAVRIAARRDSGSQVLEEVHR